MRINNKNNKDFFPFNIGARLKSYLDSSRSTVCTTPTDNGAHCDWSCLVSRCEEADSGSTFAGRYSTPSSRSFPTRRWGSNVSWALVLVVELPAAKMLLDQVFQSNSSPANLDGVVSSGMLCDLAQLFISWRREDQPKQFKISAVLSRDVHPIYLHIKYRYPQEECKCTVVQTVKSVKSGITNKVSRGGCVQALPQTQAAAPCLCHSRHRIRRSSRGRSRYKAAHSARGKQYPPPTPPDTENTHGRHHWRPRPKTQQTCLRLQAKHPQ